MVDLKDRSILEKFGGAAGSSLHGDDVIAAYWNDEVDEIKYQIAEGSEIDQVNAQWHANICGLGDIFDPVQRRTALRSMYRYNFKKTMRGFFNPCRIYSLNDEGGLVISEWPEGKYRPVVPLPYSGETQNGYEYQAAILMIQEGLIDEGMEAIKAIRDRYDGEKRNPWNEFECGSNCARSMASFALIPAFSGFEFDMVKGMIGFNPIGPSVEDYRTFWSLDSGWGTFEMTLGSSELNVLHGELRISTLRIPDSMKDRIRDIALGGQPIRWSRKDRDVHFPETITIGERQSLHIGE